MVEPVASIGAPSPTRSSGSYLLLQMGFVFYSVVAALVVIRSLYLSIGINDGLWVSSTIYRVTNPLVFGFELVPGGSAEIIGDLTIADLSLLALIVAVPFILLSRRSKD